jgi:NTP pyrophosphatase (non-canonical NTP hydrolase)
LKINDRRGVYGMDNNTTIDLIKKKIIKFRDERNWKKYHDPKNLAIGLSIEVAELQEIFLWQSKEDIETVLSSNKIMHRIREEIADIFIFLLYLCEGCKIDLSEAVLEKINTNTKKYPVAKSYNSNKKYTELGDE